MGLPPSSVSRWLVDTEPRAERIAEIAKFLAVDVKWLIYGDEEEISPAVLREDPATYKFTPKTVPMRDDGELTIMERLARLEAEHTDTLKELAEMQRTLGSLMDLLGGKVREEEPRQNKATS